MLTPDARLRADGTSCIVVRTRAEWGDCDPSGSAFASRFYHWMDLASHVLAEEMGIRAEDMMPPTLMGFPVVSAKSELLKTVLYRDWLEVRATIGRIGRTSFGVRHEIWRVNAEHELVMRGSEDRVFVSREDGRLRGRELTPEMRAVLTTHLDQSDPGIRGRVDSGRAHST